MSDEQSTVLINPQTSKIDLTDSITVQNLLEKLKKFYERITYIKEDTYESINREVQVEADGPRSWKDDRNKQTEPPWLTLLDKILGPLRITGKKLCLPFSYHL